MSKHNVFPIYAPAVHRRHDRANDQECSLRKVRV
jgi:hypothetical protein